ncbi:MAG: proton-conducting transporter membrane subunit, partial [Anaerolineales bacterium]
MIAAYLWIFAPLVVAGLLLLVRNDRWSAVLGSLASLLLAGAAARLPVNAPIAFGPLAFRIEAGLTILGRRLVIEPSDQPLLVLIYGMLAFWLFGTLAVGNARRLAPFGLAITAAMVAALSVQPFLYAALIIQMTVLAAVALLVSPGRAPSRGALRLLVYLSLGMPFILLAGFLLSGVEASPADLALVLQSAVLLGMGFAFLLAIFPFHTWVPMISEEHPPYVVSFILILLTTIVLLFGMGFLDRFTWLRESSQVRAALQLVGLIMMVVGGGWAAFQRHLGRILGYAFIAETGVSLLALSLPDQRLGVQLIFWLILPRVIAMGVWAMAANVLRFRAASLGFADVRGLLRSLPVASAALVLASLSLQGVPLLSSFPVRQALWEQLAQ